MKCYIGVDLGSTTTKAVVIDADKHVLGRGITNSRSNYGIAAAVAKREAMINTRFTLFRQALAGASLPVAVDDFLQALERQFRLQQYLDNLADLERTCAEHAGSSRVAGQAQGLRSALGTLFERLRAEASDLFRPGAARKSDFFRDIAGSCYLAVAEDVARSGEASFDALVNLYDRSIIAVENRLSEENDVAMLGRALEAVYREQAQLGSAMERLREQVGRALAVELEEAYVVGTGYGRATLPFSKEHIRSEILCHGLGAHMMYPHTATVLDIGGQDTKAIQVDADGVVENFQMNDRCAAGCGRYLGYIADEMNVGLHELGPIAMQSTRNVRINSTCTVFAGAELRDRLSLGEKREDILNGLHRAIMLRAMSILSRSGGVRDEFTFTGGVAKNEAAVTALKQLVRENFGERTLNINPDSIYTGALGAAEFARRAVA